MIDNSIKYPTVQVFSPVSIGNVSVGFDSLGLALKPLDGSLLGDVVTVESAAENVHSFQLSGQFAHRLPADKESNIVWHVLEVFDEELTTKGLNKIAVHISLQKNIPVSSGLGSSACSVVAAFVALNHFYQQPFSDHELLLLMGEAEAKISGSLHFDNVAPCFLGGMQLMLNNQEQVSVSLPHLEDIYWVLAYPDVLVSTQAARDLLPVNYDRATLIRFGQNLASFVAACYRQDSQLACSLLKDEIAEPYRMELLPQYEKTKKHLLTIGSLAVGISGSGPTLFSACADLETAQAQASWLQSNYLQTKSGFATICQADTSGTRLLNQD